MLLFYTLLQKKFEHSIKIVKKFIFYIENREVYNFESLLIMGP